ncbi:rab5 GDP/GTP exchange factor isoform X2 [Chelmon rostratus]|uniref:rab5 GDP/GTP exchange factor isoform X2 n=1 Tax=Chelmon rostratus TaxID=109905 RepID=UPI001BEABF71|nr:rab5 GDP/GTP exchange factor isoform X2 [Chelmon rostratus]
MSQRTERRGIHVDQSDLLCKKGCGYYGNAAWQGLCSKCWREEYQRVRQKQIQDDWALAEKLQREEEAAYASSHGAQTQSHSQSTAPPPHPGHASLGPFSKFEEKKTNEKTRKVTTVKKFFSPSSRTAPKKETQEGKTPSPSISRHASFDTDQVSKDFVDFLKNLQKPGREIHKQCRAFIVNMSSKKDLSADELSECVQDFYQNMADRLMSHFKGSSDSVEQVMDQVEKYIMTRLYKSVFCPETTDDEKKDLATQTRIRALHWVTIQMLCVSMDEEIPEVSENVVKAITVLCGGLHREVGRSVSQPFPGGVRALHVGPSVTTIQQLGGGLAPDGPNAWRDRDQPRPGSAQSQPGAAVGPERPAGDADGGGSEPAGRPPLLARGSPAGGERRPGEIPPGDCSPHSVCNRCQQHGRRRPATAPHAPGVCWVTESRTTRGPRFETCARCLCFHLH